jgi:excisionase family DNA binding protein
MSKSHEVGSDDSLISSEVIELAKISRRTLERWVADGKLPAVKIGGFGARRYRRTDVEALLRGESARGGDSE